MRTCKECDEEFEPSGRERICPDCELQREIEAEEEREMRKQNV